MAVFIHESRIDVIAKSGEQAALFPYVSTQKEFKQQGLEPLVENIYSSDVYTTYEQSPQGKDLKNRFIKLLLAAYLETHTDDLQPIDMGEIEKKAAQFYDQILSQNSGRTPIGMLFKEELTLELSKHALVKHDNPVDYFAIAETIACGMFMFSARLCQLLNIAAVISILFAPPLFTVGFIVAALSSDIITAVMGSLALLVSMTKILFSRDDKPLFSEALPRAPIFSPIGSPSKAGMFLYNNRNDEFAPSAPSAPQMAVVLV